MKKLLFSLLAVILVSDLALVAAACGEGRQNDYEWNWAADNQDIVAGTLHMQLTYTVIYAGQMHFTVRINDDDYNDWDYLWMVFDQNQNGKIDLGTIDSPYGLWANNMTAPAGLFQNRLAFAEVPPKPGPHKCVFDLNTGYTFDVSIPDLEGADSVLLRLGFVDMDVPYGSIGAVNTSDVTIIIGNEERK
jgi:hypothetical protein